MFITFLKNIFNVVLPALRSLTKAFFSGVMHFLFSSLLLSFCLLSFASSYTYFDILSLTATFNYFSINGAVTKQVFFLFILIELKRLPPGFRECIKTTVVQIPALSAYLSM